MKSMRPHPHRRRLHLRQLSELTVLDVQRGETTVIYETAELIEAPNWTPDGQWLIFNADGRLFRISPDGQRGPERINTQPVENLNNDHVVSPDGQWLFLSSNDGHLYRVAIEGGAPERISNDQDPTRHFRYYLHGISPDGNTLSYVGLENRSTGEGIQTRICTLPAQGGQDQYLTDGTCPVDGPEFSADGQWLYFNSEAAALQPGHAQIFRMRLDGSEQHQLTFDERVNWFPHVSPNNQLVAYLSYPPGTEGHPPDRPVELRLMDQEGTSAKCLASFWGGQGTINVNSWAPDSERLAYVAYPIHEIPRGSHH